MEGWREGGVGGRYTQRMEILVEIEAIVMDGSLFTWDTIEGFGIEFGGGELSSPMIS